MSSPTHTTIYTIYLWGYGEPHNPQIWEQGSETEAACRQAARRGWNPRRAGAWAREITVPLNLEGALAVAEGLVSADADAIGWKLRLLPGP